jgi:hypothetical protein
VPKFEAPNSPLDLTALTEWSEKSASMAGRERVRSGLVSEWQTRGADYEALRGALLNSHGEAISHQKKTKEQAKAYLSQASKIYSNQRFSEVNLGHPQPTEAQLVLTRLDQKTGEISFCVMPRVTFEPPNGNHSRRYAYVYPNGLMFPEVAGGISLAAYPVKINGSSDAHVYPLIPEALKDIDLAAKILNDTHYTDKRLKSLGTDGLVDVIKAAPIVMRERQAAERQNEAFITPGGIVYFARTIKDGLPYTGLHRMPEEGNGPYRPTRVEYESLQPWHSRITEEDLSKMSDQVKNLDEYSLSAAMIARIQQVNLNGDWATISDL